jgi:hypothetical protein
MNRYHLEIIIGGQYAGQYGMTYQTIEADGFEYGTSGAYRFWNRVGESDMGINKTEITAMYPIDRTIIRKIEKDIDGTR